MFGFNTIRLARLRRRRVRLLAGIKFLDRMNHRAGSMPQYYVDKMLDLTVELADVECQITQLEKKNDTA